MTDNLRKSFDAFSELVVREFMKAKYPHYVIESNQFKALKEEYYSLLAKSPRQMNLGLDENSFCKVVLFTVLETLEKGKIVKEKLEDKYSELLRSVKELPRANRAWAYLQAFDCDVDEIDLSETLTIRRATVLERVLYEQNKESLWGRSAGKYIIETKPGVHYIEEVEEQSGISFSIDKKRYRPKPSIGIEIQDTVNVIRLIHPSWVGITSVHFEVPLDKKHQFTIDFSFPPLPELFPCVFNPYILAECHLSVDKVEFLLRLWKRYRNIMEKSNEKRVRKIARAIRRLNSATMSNNLEDMIVDLIIGLEILFETSGYRMVLYASTLVGLNDTERLQSASILEKAYDARSKIVHGGSLKDSQRTVILECLNRFTRIIIFVLAMEGRKDLVKIVQTAAYDSSTKEDLVTKLSEWTVP